MAPEIEPYQSLQSQLAEPACSSRRLMRFAELFKKIVVGKTEVVGREHLASLPPGTPVVIASTHISDIDIPLVVAELGHKFDMVVTDLSIHRRIGTAIRSSDPTILSIWIAGSKNFLPLTYLQEKGERKGRINPLDMEKIKEAVESGKTPVIAAHNPTFDGMLSDIPGYAAVRTALSIDNAVLIPVAVQIGQGLNLLGLAKTMVQTIFKRPSAKISIGKPLIFNNPAAKQAVIAIEKILISRGGNLTEDDKGQIRMARQVVNQEGARLMRALARMLPPERRGRWGAEIQDNF